MNQITFQPSRDGFDFTSQQKKEQFSQFIVSSSSDFKNFLATSTTYIDKSLFIKDIINAGERIIYLSRPRKWGKSLNMSMLRYFFEFEVNQQNGNPKQKASNKLLFLGGRQENSSKKKIYKKLKISQNEQLFQTHFGNYIVIHLNLAKLSVSNTLQEVKKSLTIYFYDLFTKYSYLKHSKSEKWVKIFEDCYSELERNAKEQIKGQLRLPHYINKLCQCLYQYHKKQCLILIDQFDNIVNNMISNNSDIRDCDYISKQLLSLLQNNQQNQQVIFKTIATGVLNSIRDLIVSSANKIFCFDIRHYKFSSYFGVTWDQIQKYFIESLLNQEQFKDKQKQLKKRIKKWYNGYNIEVNNKCQEIYNPFSIVEYLKECSYRGMIVQGKQFWSVETCNNRILTKFFDKCEEQYVLKIFQIFNAEGENKKEEKKPIQVLQYQTQQYNILQIDQQKSIPQKSMNGLMVDLGYLTYKNVDNEIKLSIPNQQIKDGINKFLKKWFKNKNLVSQSQINIEDMKQFITKTQDLINAARNNTFSVNEFNFHSLLHAIYVFSNSSHVVTTQKNSGFGILDHLFIPRLNHRNLKNKQTAVIHEYKFYTNPQQFNKRQSTEQHYIQLALWQIILKNYVEIINQKSNQIKKVILRAVVIQKQSRESNYIKIIGHQEILNKDQYQKIYQFFNKIMQIKAELSQLNDDDIATIIKQKCKTENPSIFLKLILKKTQRQIGQILKTITQALRNKNSSKQRREKFPEHTKGSKKK